MEPEFTRRYSARVKAYKKAEGLDRCSGAKFSIHSITEDIELNAQDFFEAYKSAQEYLKVLTTNADWSYGEVLAIVFQSEVFIGIKISDDEPMGVVNGILDKGFRGMPCAGVEGEL